MRLLVRILKWAVLVALGLLVAVQFHRPAKTNPPVDQSKTIEAHTQMTPQVKAILDRSCRDCHSNGTRWPWYSHVAPVSWLVVDDVNHGRKDMNLSDWGQYDQSEAANKLRDMCREVRAGVMPLNSYTFIHRGAKLSAEDVKVLCDWTAAERARLSSP
jgi:hypothetical protein